MATLTILYIVLAGIIALGVSLFQYFYKSRQSKGLGITFTALRFLSIFALLLLLINPKIKDISYETIKPVLAIAVDNSVSIDNLDSSDKVRSSVAQLQENKSLKERFELDFYSFGREIKAMDSLSFSESQTDIGNALNIFGSIYKFRNYVPLLITDGNATVGEDYQYTVQNFKNPVYFLTAGDTLIYDDLKIDRINLNRYAYLDNKFPVEIISSYSGNNEISTQLEITSGNSVVHRENLTFGPNQKSRIINFFLPANSVGVRQYKARLIPNESEKNTANNQKNFAVEIIDQKTDVLIIYSTLHPDLGALKKSIESNRLRAVTLHDSSIESDKLNGYELVVLFQPERSFSKIYEEIKRLNKNTINIAGPNLDNSFLNRAQESFRNAISGQSDEAQAIFNPNFSAFFIEDIGFEDFPPLETAFGNIAINGDSDIALYQKINGIPTDIPLLAITENQNRREVILFGIGIWKWRAQIYLENKTFLDFDNFVDKLIQFAASSEKKTRLRIDYDSFYYGGEGIQIEAQYFNKNYVFDPGQTLNIKITNTETNKTYEVPLIVNNTSYEAPIGNLAPGNYNFTVTAKGAQLSRSGNFTIVPYDIEKQSLNADWTKIKNSAKINNGMALVLGQEDILIENLLKDSQFKPVQKTVEKIVPLIDFKILLFIIVACLAAEWFIRKYNGLI